MKLVIHDLCRDDWGKIKEEYGDCDIVCDNGTIKPWQNRAWCLEGCLFT